LGGGPSYIRRVASSPPGPPSEPPELEAPELLAPPELVEPLEPLEPFGAFINMSVD
jgi:hypothetical protein